MKQSGRAYQLPVPTALKPLLRSLFDLHYLAIGTWRRLVILFYKEPLLRSRAAEAGRNLQIYEFPKIKGDVDLYLGDRAMLTGPVDIQGVENGPRGRLILKRGASLGGQSCVTVEKEVVLEEDAIVSTDCRISDVESYPGANAAPGPQPIRIGRYAWVGNRTQILKGVRIGEGAIIGANSVVASDIPDYCVAMGNPAQVFFRNVGKPKLTNSRAGERVDRLN